MTTMSPQPSNGPEITQISVTGSLERSLVIPAHCTNLDRRARELKTVRDQMNKEYLGSSRPAFGVLDRISPHAMAVSDQMLSRLERLHLLLDRALIDVAKRWFLDEAARFPQRMPLDPGEEALLRWVDDAEFMPDYQHHVGCWRTDVLFGRSPDGQDAEAPYVCEINGRLPLNGSLMVGFHASGIGQLGAGGETIKAMNSLEESVARITKFFDPTKPLFCLREKWPGVDSHAFLAAYTKNTKQPTYVVSPKDLEIRRDETSPTDYTLWGRSTDTLIEQWFVELLQEEWAALEPEVAQQVAMTPLNDLRTVLLVHDKRLLGILAEEIPGMVARGVLDPDEGDTLAASIPETLIPGSAAMQALLRESRDDPTVKDSYMLKVCRDGSGKGIDLGRNLTQEEWLTQLTRLAGQDALRPSQNPAVAQRLVDHHWYDIVRHEIPDKTGLEPEKFHLIASMFIFQAGKQPRQFYCGPWRLGLETHLGITSTSPGLVMGTVRRPDWPMDITVEE